MADFLYPVPDTPPDEERDWIVAFNPKWLPLLIDAVDNLQHDYLFEGMPSDASEQVDQLILMLCTPYECEQPVPSSKRSYLLHRDSIVIAGNAIAFQQNSAQAYNGHWRQEAAAINDEWTNGFTAPAGDYILRFVGVRGTSSGLLDIDIDSANDTQIEWYNATAQNNYVIDVNFTVDFDGYHVLHAKVNGKNPSSTAYRIGIISMSVIPVNGD